MVDKRNNSGDDWLIMRIEGIKQSLKYYISYKEDIEKWLNRLKEAYKKREDQFNKKLIQLNATIDKLKAQLSSL